jgi:hypothetical protein
MGNKITAVKSLQRKRARDQITRPANTTAYTAGDAISEVTTNDFFTFTNVVNSKSGSGAIESAIIHSSANVATKLDADLFLFHTTITETADNAAFVPTDAEMLTLVGVIDVATANWTVGLATAGAGGNTAIHITGLDMPFVLTGTSSTTGRTLYGQLVARNAYVPVASEVFTVDLMIAQD